MNTNTNIVLIGMPGAGKSTVGRKLSKRLDKPFVDTDLLLEQDQNMPIQAIVSRRGLAFMRDLEQRILTTLNLQNHIIATGGSAVYSSEAMQHISDIGIRVYLKISLPTLMRRVRDTGSRGLVKMPNYSLPRLYAERLNLYQANADVVFDNDRPITAIGFQQLLGQIEDYLNG